MMNSNLEKMLENVKEKFSKEDRAELLMKRSYAIEFYYKLQVNEPFRMRSHLNPEVTEEGIVYYARGKKEEIIAEAQDSNVTKVLITGVHLED